MSYRVLAGDGRMSLVEVQLETGRKHQIRLQMAHHGHPVVGDRKYGSQLKFSTGIALHARRLVVAHPVRDESLVLEAPLPKSWPRGNVAQGGAIIDRRCGVFGPQTAGPRLATLLKAE